MNIFFIRISLETLEAELQLLTSRTRSVEESIQKETELLQQLDSFLQVTFTHRHILDFLMIHLSATQNAGKTV